jgi:hypothetical protein
MRQQIASLLNQFFATAALSFEFGDRNIVEIRNRICLVEPATVAQFYEKLMMQRERGESGIGAHMYPRGRAAFVYAGTGRIGAESPDFLIVFLNLSLQKRRQLSTYSHTFLRANYYSRLWKK